MKNSFLIYVLALIFLSSCSVLKKTNTTKNDDEKNKMQYIYYFDEANKNRLNGNLTEAEKNYQTALSYNKESAASYFYLAKINLQKEDLTSAKIYSEKSVKLQTDNFWYWLLYADILKLNGNETEALDIYEKLLNKFPGKETVYDRLTSIYEQNKKTDKLISVYEKKQKNYDYNPDTDVKLFNLYLKKKDFNSAENILSRLQQKFPGNFRYAGMAAEYYYSTEKIEKAENIYKKLLAENPENTDVLLSYALFCKKQHKNNKFYDLSKKLINSDLDFYKKTNLLNSGRFPNFPKNQYFELLNDLYLHHPDELIANTLFAEYYLKEDNKKKALPYVRKAAFINPEDFNLALMLFSLSYDTKSFKQLSEDTGKFLEYYPNKPDIFFYKGIAEYNLKKYKQAEKDLFAGKNLIIDNKELNDQFNFYLCLTYKKTGKIKKAISFAEKLLKDNNKDIKIYELYGDLLFLNNQKNKALEFWKKAKENGNNTEHLLFKIKNFNELTADDIKN